MSTDSVRRRGLTFLRSRCRDKIARPLIALFISVGSFASASDIEAQTITLRSGNGGASGVLPQEGFVVPLNVELPPSGGSVRSLSVAVIWDPGIATYSSTTAGGFGTLTVDDSRVAAGRLDLSMIGQTATTASFELAQVHFQASSSSSLGSIAVVGISGTDGQGQDILGLLGTDDLDVCVGTDGLWGDVTGDGVTNIIDAQQIARFSVGLAVSDPQRMADAGDVTDDGTVNIIDAQQVARFSVGLPAAPRTGQPKPVMCSVSDDPLIWVRPESLAFTAPEGQDPAAAQIDIVNLGDADLNWSISATGAFLSTQPASGSLGPGLSGSVDVAVSGAGLTEGMHFGSLEISDPAATNSPFVVPVSVTITPAIDPCGVVAGQLTPPNLGSPAAAVNGTLDGSDCVAAPGGPFSERWTMTLPTDMGLKLSINSGDFSPRLVLEDDQGQVVAGPASNLREKLAPGDYVVVATSASAGGIGDYTIELEQFDRCASNRGTLAIPETKSRNLRPIDCLLLNGRRADRWELTVAVPTVVQLDLKSTDFNAQLHLVRDQVTDPSDPLQAGGVLARNNDFSGTDSRITYPLDPGTYGVYASARPAGATGFYTISAMEALQIDTRSPDVGETDVEIGSNIVVTFAEPIDPATLDATTFSVSDGSTVAGTLSLDGTNTVVTFQPTVPWAEFETQYTVTLTSGITSTAGAALQETSWTFTTVLLDENSLYQISNGHLGSGTVLETHGVTNECVFLPVASATTASLWYVTRGANGYKMQSVGGGSGMALAANGGNNPCALEPIASFAGQFWSFPAGGPSASFKMQSLRDGAARSLDIYNDGRNPEQAFMEVTQQTAGQDWRLTNVGLKSSPPAGVCDITRDLDQDRIPNCYETGTLSYASIVDTGTLAVWDDSDSDGLTDGDEVFGTVDALDLPSFGVSPLRQDILIEYDWFNDSNGCVPHTHRPTSDVIARVEAAFANSPHFNPDGSTGINVIQDYGNGPLQGGNTVADADGVIAGGVDGTDFAAIKAANFAPNRIGYFHYTLMPHQYNTNSLSSGEAEIGGDDMIVSLQCNNSLSATANTIMHELGHNLTLRHGGADTVNFKPNYNSIMNYKYQFPGVDNNCTPPGDGVLDYSHGTRANLDENDLNEALGVCGGIPVDWNADGFIFTGVVEDINVNSQGIGDGQLSLLRDNNDWGRLSLRGILNAVSTQIISCINTPPAS